MYIDKNCFGECSSPAPGVGRIAIRADVLIFKELMWAAKKKEGDNHSITGFFIEYKEDSTKVCYTCDHGDVELCDCDNVDDVIIYFRGNTTLDVHKNIYIGWKTRAFMPLKRSELVELVPGDKVYINTPVDFKEVTIISHLFFNMYLKEPTWCINTTAGCFKEGELLRSCEVDTPRKINKYYVVEMNLLDETIEDINECPDYESAEELLRTSVSITCEEYQEIPGAISYKKFIIEPRGYEHEHKEDWIKAITKCTEGSEVTDHRVFCIVECL